MWWPGGGASASRSSVVGAQAGVRHVGRRTSTPARLDVGRRPSGERDAARPSAFSAFAVAARQRRRRSRPPGAPRPTATARVPADPPQERHDAVAGRDRAVDVERGDDGRGSGAGTAAHGVMGARRPSRTVQNPGQLFDTTSGSTTTMPATAVPSTPNAIARRWSWWVPARRRAAGRPARCAARRRSTVDVGADRAAARSARSPRRSLSLARMKPTPRDRRRRRRRDGHGGERRHEVRHVGHVDVDAGERAVGIARDGEPAAVVVDGAPHRGRAGRRTRRRPAPSGGAARRPGPARRRRRPSPAGSSPRRRRARSSGRGRGSAPAATTISSVADLDAVDAERRHHRGRQPDVGHRDQRRRQLAAAGRRRAAGRSASAP